MPISANVVAAEGCGRLNCAVDDFSALVRAAREREGWTQDELANAAGVSRSMVQNVENPEWTAARGKPPPTRRMLLKIARALKIPEDKVPARNTNGDRAHSAPASLDLSAFSKDGTPLDQQAVLKPLQDDVLRRLVEAATHFLKSREPREVKLPPPGRQRGRAAG